MPSQTIVPSTGSDVPLSVPLDTEEVVLTPQKQAEVAKEYEEYVKTRTDPEVAKLDKANARAMNAGNLVNFLTETNVLKYAVDNKEAVKHPDKYCKPHAKKLMETVDYAKPPKDKKLFKDNLFYETLGDAVIVAQTCNDSLAKWDYSYQFLLWVKDNYRVYEAVTPRAAIVAALKREPRIEGIDKWNLRKVRVP